MSNKHTPGPWKCVSSNSARTFNQISIRPVRPVIKGMQLPLAKVLRGDLSEYGGGDGHANALLIAAAPELLDVLLRMTEYADDGTPIHPTDNLMQEARAVVARAVGAA